MFKRVLHVDDDPDWLARVSELLSTADIGVDSFTNLTEAQQAYYGGAYDLVICDGNINSREGDGIKWALELYFNGEKVILLTADPPISNIPSFDKGFMVDERQSFLELVKEL